MFIPFAADAAVIGFGAACGAVSRYSIGRFAAERVAADPKRFGKWAGWHTAGINIGGSFLLGGIAGSPVMASSPPPAVPLPPSLSPSPSPSSAPSPINQQYNITRKTSIMPGGLTPRMKLLMGVGFCGSFTTFSTYSVDVLGWISKGEVVKALGYIMTNNIGGICAAGAGLKLAKLFF